jgi:hypothetical protein
MYQFSILERGWGRDLIEAKLTDWLTVLIFVPPGLYGCDRLNDEFGLRRCQPSFAAA